MPHAWPPIEALGPAPRTRLNSSVRQPFGERQTGAVAMPMIAARMFDFDPPRR
jgi:hypothetical protein